MPVDDSQPPPPRSGDRSTVGSWLASRGLRGKEARRHLDNGKVWIESTPTRDASRSAEPQQLRIEESRPKFDVEREPAVVYRDTKLVVVYKPSGVLSVPAPGRREPSVLRDCERWFGRALAVHRIDEGTSGLMLVALDEPTQTRLKNLFEVHDVERRYIAWVNGTFPAAPQTIESWLVRDRGDGLRGSHPRGSPPPGDAKRAVTHFRRISVEAGRSLVEARLETGRTHQVRIHLSEAGFPLVGDDLYGRARGGRLALHAHALGFRHPATGVSHRYVSPLPDDLARAAEPRPA